MATRVAASGSRARLQIAASIAARTGATRDGAFVTPPFIPPFRGVDGASFVPPDTVRFMLDAHLEFDRQAEQTVRTTFDSATMEADAPAEWTMLGDETVLGFVGLARACDLVVFPKSGASYPPLSAAELARDTAVQSYSSPTRRVRTNPAVGCSWPGMGRGRRPGPCWA